MKKLFVLLLAALMLCACALASAEMTKEEIQTLFDSEMHEARYITQRGKAYEYEPFQRYLSFWFQKVWSVTDYKKIPITDVENAEEILTTLRSLREQLVQVVDDPESVAWYIWGESMPQAAGADAYDYTCAYDEAGLTHQEQAFLKEYKLAQRRRAVHGGKPV